MSDTVLPNIGLTQIEVGASEDTWGTKYNTDMGIIDALFAAAGSGTSVGLKVGAGKTLDATGGTVNVTDSLFSIKDNSDATKIAKFELSGITTATTRTFTFPDASGTLLYNGQSGATFVAPALGAATATGILVTSAGSLTAGFRGTSSGPIIADIDNLGSGQAGLNIVGNGSGASNTLSLSSGSSGQAIAADNNLSITATGGTITLATKTLATSLYTSGTLRAMGNTAPASGAGMEMVYGSNIGLLLSYDRDGSAYKETNIAGLGVSLLYQSTKMISITSSGSGSGVQFPTYGAGAITADSGGNLTAVSDPSQKIFTGSFTAGLPEILKLATNDEFMGLHKWTEESGMETHDVYASFFARDSFPVPKAVWKNPKNGINSFMDRPVVMALVNAVAELSAEIKALKGRAAE